MPLRRTHSREIWPQEMLEMRNLIISTCRFLSWSVCISLNSAADSKTKCLQCRLLNKKTPAVGNSVASGERSPPRQLSAWTHGARTAVKQGAPYAQDSEYDPGSTAEPSLPVSLGAFLPSTCELPCSFKSTGPPFGVW